MCGLVGVYWQDRGRPVDPARLLAQTDALLHRGPDDGGVWYAGGIGLGHRRLSIIDLSPAGHQPMFDASGRHVVVFNGEIYNYRELKAELSRAGHRFKSDSDTETLLAAYVEWGERCVERLNGMFAFAIYDRRDHALFLARDRLGKKPLYYYRDAERVIFASELKAILADPTVPRDVDATAVADYFALSYVPSPKSILRGIHKLPAAHTLSLGREHFTLREYWDVDFTAPDRDKSEERHAEELLELLTDAVRLRLHADVPLGAFLSGGVDSSAVVGLMARLEPARAVLTSSIGFDVARYDERAYARQIAERFGTSHREQLLRPDAGAIVRQLSYFYDEPFGDSSAAPTYYLCAMTRQHVTVALSGDGGDELFAGYYHYRDALWADGVRRRAPGYLWSLAAGPVARLFHISRYSPRAHGYARLAYRAAIGADRAGYDALIPEPRRFREMLGADFLRALGPYDPFEDYAGLLSRARTSELVPRLQYADIKAYLPDDILVKVDRASMAHALEVRCPLLDHRVVERAARIPSELQLEGSRSKRVLKRAIAGFIPPETFDRKKMGFAIPIAKWFRTALKGPAEALIFGEPGGGSGVLARGEARRLWLEHQAGLVDHGTQLWNAMMFELWHQRFVRRDAVGVDETPTMRGARPATDDTPSAPVWAER